MERMPIWITLVGLMLMFNESGMLLFNAIGVIMFVGGKVMQRT